ncbi:MAG: hypothetical protein KME54_29485 [Tolypothrix brevis GSE-NOS-MK-07-07A]|jgi:hypothetical protein|nr:hypothetical protein [Tolypothrix brevis GSE-NOS-MK-07-07A]
MSQRLKFVTNPRVGLSVFVSPHVNEPWGEMQGEITRVVKSQILLKFPDGISEEFPKMVLYELEQL